MAWAALCVVEPHSHKPPLLCRLITLTWSVAGTHVWAARLVPYLAALVVVLLNRRMARVLFAILLENQGWLMVPRREMRDWAVQAAMVYNGQRRRHLRCGQPAAWHDDCETTATTAAAFHLQRAYGFIAVSAGCKRALAAALQ